MGSESLIEELKNLKVSNGLTRTLNRWNQAGINHEYPNRSRKTMILPSKDITPIRIRNNLQVLIAHLPHDLTSQEAAKINRVIMAHVKSDDSTGGQPDA